VALDATVTPELWAEGMAREVVSRVQRMRKEARLEVSDRIVLAVQGDAAILTAVEAHREHIAGEVLAVQLFIGEQAERPDAIAAAGDSWTASQDTDVDGHRVSLALSKDGV
jgi:isoleucyl-tRNA synthetase